MRCKADGQARYEFAFEKILPCLIVCFSSQFNKRIASKKGNYRVRVVFLDAIIDEPVKFVAYGLKRSYDILLTRNNRVQEFDAYNASILNRHE